VFVRKEGWPNWLPISGDGPLLEKQLAWDTTSLPSGVYRLRLTAGDRAHNPAAEARESVWESAPFVIDHVAPSVRVEALGGKITAVVDDDWTRVARAECAIDGGPWRPLFAIDGLFDTRRERVEIDVAALAVGAHVVVVRAVDAAGNIGSGDAVIEVTEESAKVRP
jgi:hypothetical protein